MRPDALRMSPRHDGMLAGSGTALVGLNPSHADLSYVRRQADGIAQRARLAGGLLHDAPVPLAVGAECVEEGEARGIQPADAVVVRVSHEEVLAIAREREAHRMREPPRTGPFASSDACNQLADGGDPSQIHPLLGQSEATHAMSPALGYVDELAAAHDAARRGELASWGSRSTNLAGLTPVLVEHTKDMVV